MLLGKDFWLAIVDDVGRMGWANKIRYGMRDGIGRCLVWSMTVLSVAMSGKGEFALDDCCQDGSNGIVLIRIVIGISEDRIKY